MFQAAVAFLALVGTEYRSRLRLQIPVTIATAVTVAVTFLPVTTKEEVPRFLNKILVGRGGYRLDLTSSPEVQGFPFTFFFRLCQVLLSVSSELGLGLGSLGSGSLVNNSSHASSCSGNMDSRPEMEALEEDMVSAQEVLKEEEMDRLRQLLQNKDTARDTVSSPSVHGWTMVTQYWTGLPIRFSLVENLVHNGPTGVLAPPVADWLGLLG